MRINPQIKSTLVEIAKESVTHANTPNPDYRHVRRIIKVFDTHLSPEERVFLVFLILELIHYRNITTDHDTLLTIADVKVKTFMGVGTIAVFVMVIAAILFRTNDNLNRLVDLLLGFTKILSL